MNSFNWWHMVVLEEIGLPDLSALTEGSNFKMCEELLIVSTIIFLLLNRPEYTRSQLSFCMVLQIGPGSFRILLVWYRRWWSMKSFIWKQTYQNKISVIFYSAKPVHGNGQDQGSNPDATPSSAAVVFLEDKRSETKLSQKFDCDPQCFLPHLWWCLQAVTLRE